MDYATATYSYRPDRLMLSISNERTIMSTIINRIGTDAAAMDIRHCYTDKSKNYSFSGYVDSTLDKCLRERANIDQTGRALLRDIVMSMLDEGVVAVIPIDTDRDPITGAFKIESLRVGKILQWKPCSVQVRAYDERTCRQKDIWCSKDTTAIIENPFYAIMNEYNSTLYRLGRKLSLLDTSDEQNASGKLDLIVQLPYAIKTPARKEEARKRVNDIRDQLTNSNYGIAYTDGAERITQLNRSVENNLLKQVEFFTNQLMSFLGITPEILNGTADEKTMNNYINRTILTILTAITEEFTIKFLSETARTQGQKILYFNDPLKLMSASQLAENADKLTRNEILSSNEIRTKLGYPPSDDPKADQLRNSNMPQAEEEPAATESGTTEPQSSEAMVNSIISRLSNKEEDQNEV